MVIDVLGQELIRSSNSFTIFLYKQIYSKNEDNVVVSPFSAETVLALLYSGAKGSTASEIKQCLRLSNDFEKNQHGFKILRTLLCKTKYYNYQSANKIYVPKNLQMTSSFRNTAKTIFGVYLENTDYTPGEEVAEKINEWMQTHTEDAITKVVEPQDLKNDTKLVVFNALYFKSGWLRRFLKRETLKRDFYKYNGEKIQVKSMSKRFIEDFYHCGELKARFLRIKHTSENITFTIVLPDKKDGLPEIEKNIDTVLRNHEYTKQSISLHIPKFKIHTSINFAEILQNLGVKKAFTSGNADFSNISGKKGNLFISKISHDCVISLTEKGVEAVDLADLQPEDRQILTDAIRFHVDHPFLFIIRYKDLILFIGRVTDPETKIKTEETEPKQETK